MNIGKRGSGNEGILRVLLVGALSPRIGGTTILVEQLVRELRQREDVDITVVDVGGIRHNGVRGMVRYLRALCEVFSAARGEDVLSLHINRTALAVLGPAVLAAARLQGCAFVVRTFGGKGYAWLGPCAGRVARSVISRADLFLVETKSLVREVCDDGIPHVEWYSNSRPMPRADQEASDREHCSSFVYIGRLCPEKGIHEMIAAAERFEGGVRVDVYGPFRPSGLSERIFSGLKRVRYCGVLNPEDVHTVLARSDAVILPSRYSGEGYPGIILEAYGAGIPVVTTRIGGIPEIVDESCAIMVEPGDIDALFEAMKTLVEDDELYVRLCEGAKRKRDAFSSDLLTERFVTLCRQVLSRRADGGN